MSVPILYQANAILQAREEGFVHGVISSIEEINNVFPLAKRTNFVKTLKSNQFSQEEINYWLEQYKL